MLAPDLRESRVRPDPSSSTPVILTYPVRSKGCHNWANSFLRLVEELGLSPSDVVKERLEAEPAGQVVPDLGVGELGHLILDQDRLAGRFSQQLSLAAPVHGDKPESSFVHRLSDSEQSVVS